ncbi:MAG TPA: hypothetical protein VIS96_12165 [Terrimicrobiaceae bacterium]
MHPALRIAQLLRLLGRVEGRKKFQKLVHILKELDYPFTETFEFSYYGMYSQQLRSELDSLAADSLIVERRSINQFGCPFFEFESTPKLSAFLEELDVEVDPDWARAAKKLNSLQAQILEGVSTILFLRRRGLEGHQLKQRVLSLKPHLAEYYEQCERQANEILDCGKRMAPSVAD